MMGKFIVIAVIIALVYIFALSPQNKAKVNTTALDTMQNIGEFAKEKIQNPNEQTPATNATTGETTTTSLTDYGRPKCVSNSDCTQFGSNVTCNATTGNCIG
ncbi:MAG: hypothetical protein HY376_02940 [Candidatus Blackburnbacteria bacterium]|nr:hypothetical protein [Candidatus Blackburnbacteria bacterium]